MRYDIKAIDGKSEVIALRVDAASLRRIYNNGLLTLAGCGASAKTHAGSSSARRSTTKR